MNGKEAFKKIRENTCMGIYDEEVARLIPIVEKDLGILEIIKKKKVDLRKVEVVSNVNWYNSYGKFVDNPLTETEFNLIKEWLEK